MFIPSLRFFFFKKSDKRIKIPHNIQSVLLIFTDYQSQVRPDWLKVTITSNTPNILCMAEYLQVSMLLAASREREKNLPVFLIIFF